MTKITQTKSNKGQEKIDNQGNTKQFNSIENRDNSPYEQHRLKKQASPPIKIGNTKQVLGKIVLGKIKGGGDKWKDTKQVFFFIKKLRIHMKKKYFLFQ